MILSWDKYFEDGASVFNSLKFYYVVTEKYMWPDLIGVNGCLHEDATDLEIAWMDLVTPFRHYYRQRDP
jgi:hypothetical protein